MKYSQAFIVDLGKTMVDTSRISSEGKDKQKMFCRCGHAQSFNHKIKRNIVKNHDTTVEDKQSLEAVKCEKCKTVYNHFNKVCLLVPDKEGIFSIDYKWSNWVNANGEKISTLYKEKNFAKYHSQGDRLETISKKDFIQFNNSTKKFSVFLTQPGADDDNQVGTGSSDSKSHENVSESLGLSRIAKIEHFFKYFEFVTYEGLSEAFKFFASMDLSITDINELKKLIPSISHIYKYSEITYEVDKNGELKSYQMQDSGYGDGKMMKKNLSIGSYLMNLQELAKSFIAVSSFQNITTILLTKGPEFFFEFLHSQNICNPNVYVMKGATYPAKIAEISTNFDRNGVLKKSGKDVVEKRRLVVAANVVVKNTQEQEDRNYLKVSPIMFKHIKNPTDMDVILNVYHKGYVGKKDIEGIFQTYDTDRVYRLFKQLDKHNRGDIDIKVAHLNHILKENIDENKVGHSDFLGMYTDTLRMIGLLEVGDKYIFKIKTHKELKDSHDDLTARYNAIKDAKKSEFYKKAVDDFKQLNCTIGDIGFQVIPTLELLNKEGMTMSHCIYSYLGRVCDRGYLAVHVQHILSNERATLGLIRTSKSGLEFEQLKGYQNSRASAEMIGAVIEFCKANDIPHRNGHGSDLSPNTGSRKRMGDYLSDEEVDKLRAERKKKEEANKKKKEAKKKGNEDGEKKFLGIF